jgi:hypothetical protein
MGTRGDNGGNERPQEGGGLPDLPPEWGTVIIPDDASELDDEGVSVRRSFRREAFRRRWRHRLHLKQKPMRRVDDDSPGLAVPLLIMTVAVIATLTSLFAVAWPGQRPRAVPPLVRSPQSISIADLALVDGKGVQVLLRDIAPAVILLDENCPCDAFVGATFDAVSAARPAATPASPGTSAAVVTGSAAAGRPPADHVTIIVVGQTLPKVPSLSTPAVPVVALADPKHELRTAIPALTPPSPGSDILAAAVLIDGSGSIVRVVPSVTSAQDFRNDVKLLW